LTVFIPLQDVKISFFFGNFQICNSLASSCHLRQGGQQLADGANGSNKRRLEEYSFFEWFEETTARLDNDYTNDSVCVAILQLWKRPEQYFLTVWLLGNHCNEWRWR
jgi:hypothetical protein